jgi:hypothetical protein
MLSVEPLIMAAVVAVQDDITVPEVVMAVLVL